MKRKLITIAVIGLIFLSGCSMLNPGSDTPTQETENNSELLETAAQAHLDASTVVVNNNIEQGFTISGNETIETSSKQETKTIYNYSAESYHTEGTLSQTTDGTTAERSINAYLVDGTYYTEVQTENGTQWFSQNETFSRELLFNITSLTEADTNKHFSVSQNGDNTVYTADLTNNSTFDAFFGQNVEWLTSNEHGWLIDSADKFTLTIVVSEDKQIESTSIELENELSYEELKDRDSSIDIPEDTTLEVSFTATQQFSKYNSTQVITVPKNATSP